MEQELWRHLTESTQPHRVDDPYWMPVEGRVKPKCRVCNEQVTGGEDSIDWAVGVYAFGKGSLPNQDLGSVTQSRVSQLMISLTKSSRMIAIKFDAQGNPIIETWFMDVDGATGFHPLQTLVVQ